MATPQITIAGSAKDLFGTAQAGTLWVQLCGSPNQFPRVPTGPNILAQVAPLAIAMTGGGYNFKLWGNDVIAPAGTFYTVKVVDANGNTVQTNAYQWTGTQTVSLATATAINPAPPLPPSSYGSWAPVDASGAGLVFATAEGQYSRVGRQVTAWFRVIYPTTANTATAAIGGLPMASTSAGILYPILGSAAMDTAGSSGPNGFRGGQNSTSFNIIGATNGLPIENHIFSSATLAASVTYLTD